MINRLINYSVVYNNYFIQTYYTVYINDIARGVEGLLLKFKENLIMPKIYKERSYLSFYIKNYQSHIPPNKIPGYATGIYITQFFNLIKYL